MMNVDLLERVKTSIAETFAPAIDGRAPYAKVMFDLAAREAVSQVIDACAAEASIRNHHSGGEIAEAILAMKP